MPITPDGVVLVGHGAAATDCPRELVQRLKALESRRRATGQPMSAEERALDTKVRTWPRTASTDPYAAGLTRLADALRPLLGVADLVVAFNEFAAPDVAEAVESLVARGRRHIAVVPTMLTPGGVHSEVEIPQTLRALRAVHPTVAIRYVWPFDLAQVARLLAQHTLGADPPAGASLAPTR